jgi:uncharacterized membrane protein
MQHYWFKPKRYGFGAVPSSWQGWALTIAYVLVMIGLGAWLGSGAADTQRQLMPFLVIAAAVTIVFVGLCWRTTEGGWRWRWGDDK